MNQSRRKVAIPSSHLAGLRELAFSLPQFAAAFRNLHQVRLVIDSNIVLADLIWRAKRRTNPSATTALQEVIASGTVVAYAPLQLREEVEKHIPRIAVDEGIPEERLSDEWGRYRQCLIFCEVVPGGIPKCNEERDPSDLPFIYLYAQVGAAAVVSRDKDIPAMGAAVVSLEIILLLREYSRAEVVEVSITFFGATILTGLGVGAIKLAVQAVSSLAHWFARLPDGLKIALFLGVVFAILHPRSRAAIKDSFNSAFNKIGLLMKPLEPVMYELAQSYNAERTKAARSWEEAQKAIPSNRRVSLKNLAFAVCVAARRPLALNEIERKVRLGGYKPRGRNVSTYLRRVLRRDTRFARCADGRWTIAMAQSA